MATRGFSSKMFVISACVVAASGCARVDTVRTPHSRVLKSWEARSPLEPERTEFVAAQGGLASPVLQGKVGTTRHCTVTKFTESEEKVDITHRTEGITLGLGGGIVLTGVGAGLLATAENASDKPKAGEKSSPQEKQYFWGGLATAAGGVILAHTTYQMLASIDRVEQLPNEIKEDAHDEICRFTPLPNARIEVASGELGWDPPVLAGTTDADGKLSVDLRELDRFRYPGELTGAVPIAIKANGQPAGELALGDWVTGLARQIASCYDLATCRRIRVEAQEKQHDPRYVNVVAAAEAREAVVEVKEAARVAATSLGPAILSCLHPTGRYGGIALEDYEKTESLMVLKAKIQWRGGILGTPYYSLVEIQINSESNAKVSLISENSAIPGGMTCGLSDWTPLSEFGNAARASGQALAGAIMQGVSISMGGEDPSLSDAEKARARDKKNCLAQCEGNSGKKDDVGFYSSARERCMSRCQ